MAFKIDENTWNRISEFLHISEEGSHSSSQVLSCSAPEKILCHGNSTFHGHLLKDLPLVLTLPMYSVHTVPSINSKWTLVLSSHPHQGLPRYLPRKLMPSCPRRKQPFCLQVFEYFAMYFSSLPCVLHTPSSPSSLICYPTNGWSEYKVCN